MVGWLVEGDAAIRWQTERDLLDDPAWTATREQVAREGWGRALLAAQDPDGRWGAGLYSPKWTSTHYTLQLLRRMGMPPGQPDALRGCAHLLDDADWVDGGVSYWSGRLLAERCVNGMVLATTSWFDVGDDRIDDIAALLVRSQMADGGWNCNDHLGATHSSFHTTISVLEGLAEWQRRRDTTDCAEVVGRGHEFMLAHRMFRSHTTGEIINPTWTKFSFPPRWHYDVLRGLDHLRDVDAPRDGRAAEAVELILDRRRRDGRWGIGHRHSGQTYFKMEQGPGPSRWNTLRCRRVLDWWDR